MRYTLVIFFAALFFFSACQEKYDIGIIYKKADEYKAEMSLTMGDTSYIEKDSWSGMFNKPRTIMYGLDQLLYVADTYNNRVVMLNIAGQVMSTSRFILHPIALAQDNRLDLLVGAETIEPSTNDTIGIVLRIKLVAAAHHLENAVIDTVWKEPARPKRRFVGIGVMVNDEFLIARDGPDNSSVVDPDARVLRFRHNENAPAGKKDNLITPLGEFQSGAGNGISFINHPTGLATFPNSGDFILTQKSEGVQYSAIWMVYTHTNDFDGWMPKFDPSDPNQRADFITPNRFKNAVNVGIDRIKRDIFIVDDMDAGRDSVVKFNNRGRLKTESFGTLTPGIQLKNPGGVAVSGSNSTDYTLYVCDTENNRIVLYRLNQ
ncbi:MAG: hypothetical protein H3C35_09220 [Bacteroidetes bacterium]|nr:hypothetical protein [Bacteroidota bacterium]